MTVASAGETLSRTSYSDLLKTLSTDNVASHATKRRRLTAPKSLLNGQFTIKGLDGLRTTSSRDVSQHVAIQSVSPDKRAKVDDGLDQAQSSDEDEEQILRDPFEHHYVNVVQEDLVQANSKGHKDKQKALTTEVSDSVKKTCIASAEKVKPTPSIRASADLHLKRKLRDNGKAVISSLDPLERDLTTSISAYRDVVFNCRNAHTSAKVHDICALHSLNHIFKTRDRVIKNNTRLSQSGEGEALELRDQGFTRPKVLIILPTKQSCVRFVESIVKISAPDQQENKSRFLDTHSRDGEDEWQDKPEDFQELFGGNHDEDFRIGLKFTRKTIKYFSGFYNSDIIIGSPLGLMRTIAAGGDKKDDEKSQDADFLSSVEVVVMDHANALQMQNWQHVEYVFAHLNYLPKDSHGCDFSRVRNWYLDGHAKYLRQTIITSAYPTPEVNALVSAHLHNVAGIVKYVPKYDGAMIEVASMLPLAITQTFLRFDAKRPAADADARFNYFNATVLSQIARDKNNKGVLILVPTYADFVRLRIHLENASETSAISFGSISEYNSVRETARARSHFLSGRHNVLLYSERAHHHFRYRIKGVQKVIFYGVPENPTFWADIVSVLGLDGETTQANNKSGKGLVRSLFSKWDLMKLERIVGTERVGRLISERSGDTFDFA